MRCPDCGALGSYCGVGTTGGASNWTGRAVTIRSCPECGDTYEVPHRGAPA